MTVCIDDWATEKAAQLWCLPTTSKIEMDVVLALEIAQALRDEREQCAKVSETYLDWSAQWGQDDNEAAVQVCANEITSAIRNQS